MIKAQAAAIVALALALLAGGCASPPSRFHVLAATAVPDAGSTVTSDAVMVDRVAIPAAVDRPQFVVHRGSNRVLIDEFNRWAEPLPEGITRTLAENLAVLLGTPRVVSGPLAASFDPAYRVSVDIQRFESIRGQEVFLDAVWVVRGSSAGAAATSGRSAVREAVAGEGADYEALAAAHSRALAGLSRDIAAAIRAAGGR
ncbi:PqiC family protein [Accumulibacter sp.]|uniref:PqiC family protein n=1 Tax=Accumulibacter sp. TaxID=2053492 RepID=UPI0025D1168A|nr:PqiC family protein [Accumulibacter sp.]MCM8611943.1 PqiC family protein [Accumulibacter sp.]MCM8635565.1 PqiC family protein [Accumulibacter sp.]MCM8639143.1 PqiC family protein [Accumulibacter sp.]